MNAADVYAKMNGAIYVGMLVTEQVGSDRYGAVIVWVSPSRKQAVMVRCQDDGTVTGALEGQAIRWAKDGRWYPQGARGRRIQPISLGRAQNYRDPSF